MTEFMSGANKRMHEKRNTENIQFGFQKRKLKALNDEFKKMTEVLEIQNSFRQSNNMCDVILLTDDGVRIPAHKIILASANSVFASMLNGYFRENSEQIVPIKEIDSDVLEIVIKYIYTFKLDITEKNIEKLLKAADFFDLERIIDKCFDFIEKIIDLDNCLYFMKCSLNVLNQHYSSKKLYDMIFSYALENFFQIKESSLNDLSCEEIGMFISNDSLVVQSEEQVFKFLLDWTKCDEEIRKEYLPKLVKHIRLPFISKANVLKFLQEPLLRVDVIMEYMIVYFMNIESSADNDVIESSIKRRRIPKNLNTPDVIIAIDNSYGYHSVGYLDISVTDSEWNFGNRIFLPPNKSSKIVAIENVFLFSIGGVTRNNVAINNVFSLDLSNICHNWVENTPMLSPRKNFAVCTHEKRVYAIGGVDSQGQILNSIEYFDMNTGQWYELCTMEKPRNCCSAIYHDDFLYVIGGKSVGDERLSIVERFNVPSLTWSNDIDEFPVTNGWSIYDTCVAIFKNSLYIFGGFGKQYDDEEEGLPLKTVHKCKLQNGGKWSMFSSLSRRQGASVAVLNEKMYYFGGVDPSMEPDDTTEICNPQTKTFDIVRCSNFPYTGGNVLVFSKQLLDLLGLGM